MQLLLDNPMRRIASLTALCAALGTSTLPQAGGPDPVVFTLAYVGGAQHSALLGIRQGLDEANLQGRFLGQKYLLEMIEPADAFASDLSRFIAVVAAVDKDKLLQLADVARGRAVFNLVAEDDALRAACVPNLLHVIPSTSMKRKAEAQWRQVNPDSNVVATAWHSEFVKFAGRDLNKRFQKAFNTPMGEQAWAGWAAVKMLSDSIARGEAAHAATLLDYLRSRLSFDGQKGVDMNFRPTGQLRQTLLITEGGRLVGEAPVRGVAAPDDLDSLDATVCPG